MKRYVRSFGISMLALVLVLSLAACGKKSEPAAEEPQVEVMDPMDEDLFGGMMGEGCVDLDTIKASDYVKLGDYTGFDLVLLTQTVSDVEMENELDQLLFSLQQKVDTNAPAADEDHIDLAYRLLADGEVMDEAEEFDLLLGYNNLGEDADAALLGAKPGDHLEVPVDVVMMFGMPEGTEGALELDVLKVYRYDEPELNDELIAAHTEYKTLEEYEAAIREQLQKDRDRINHYQAEEDALNMAMLEAEFLGYPQDLYDYIYGELEDLFTFYAESYDMTLEELMGEETLDAPCLEEVNKLLLVKAIAEEEKIALTDETYEAYLQENYPDFGVSSPEELKVVASEAYLRNYALRSLVGSFIMDHSQLTEMDEDAYYASYYDQEMDLPPDEE